MAEVPELMIERASAALQKPAGTSPRYASLDRIREHHLDFMLECHKSWKHWHEEAVRQLLVWDGFLLREKTHPIGPAAVEFGNYNRAVWRRVNDAIVWSLFGAQRHVVKRFCFYRPRTFLVESNAEAAMSVVAKLNANPSSIALWTDATSCVDVGDVIYVEDGRLPQPLLIELKEGGVNREILGLMELEESEFEAKFQEFAQRRNKAGVQQFHRVLRQKHTADQALELLANDRGTDPITGLTMEVLSLEVEEKTYDSELNRVLTDAHDRAAEGIELIGGCLWVYANGDPAVHRDDAARRFQELLAHRGVRLPRPDGAKIRTDDRDRIVSFRWNVFQPMAKPVFLRNLEPRIVASALYGELMFKTFLYFDMNRFAEIVAEMGARFAWSSAKNTRRAQAMRTEVRPPSFGGKVPEIHVGPVKMSLSDPSLVQIYFDGLTPHTIIGKMIETARHIQVSHGSSSKHG